MGKARQGRFLTHLSTLLPHQKAQTRLMCCCNQDKSSRYSSGLTGPSSELFHNVLVCPATPESIWIGFRCLSCNENTIAHPASLAKRIIRPIFLSQAKRSKKNIACSRLRPDAHHVHLLAPGVPTQSFCLIITLGRRYVHYINTPYGAPWDSCYKSSLIQAETCWLSYYCYIKLNSCVLAGRTIPLDCLWSSYRTNARSEAKRMIC